METVTNCPQCNAAVATSHLGEKDIALCPRCRTQFFANEQLLTAHLQPNKKATWSLVLGVVSFVGAIFTGAPAIILGVLALRDLKQRKTTNGAWKAWSGIACGTLFSLCCGGTALFIYGFIPSDDPADLAKTAAIIGQFKEKPDEIAPKISQRFMGTAQMTYEDPAEYTTIVAGFFAHSSGQNRNAVRGQAAIRRSGMRVPELSNVKNETKSFRINGTPTEFQVETGTANGRQHRVYTGVIEHPDGWLMILLWTKEQLDSDKIDPDRPARPLTEEEVKALIESFDPPEPSEK